MKEQYAIDDSFARVYDQLIEGHKHKHYTLKEGFLMMQGKLCVTHQLRQKVLTESHAPPYASHRGIDSTVTAVDHYFYWPSLWKDVEVFVRPCLICQKIKYDRQKPAGLLQPLPIPDRPWQSIAMDFVFDLPRTPIGHDGIWTIICRFNKQAHLSLCASKLQHIIWHGCSCSIY